MESDTIEAVIRCVSQEELVVLGCHVCGCKETGGQLCGSSTTTTVKILENAQY